MVILQAESVEHVAVGTPTAPGVVEQTTQVADVLGQGLHRASLSTLGFQPAPHTSLGFKAGARKTSGENLSGYIGIELARDF